MENKELFIIDSIKEKEKQKSKKKNVEFFKNFYT